MNNEPNIDQVRADLTENIKSYFKLLGPWGGGERWKLPLSIPSYGWEEVSEVMDSLLSGRVTMGNKVQQFESMFAEYIGVKHAVMVNSGSSANLCALTALAHPTRQKPIKPGDEVIVPSVPWSTTVYPIFQMGAIPVFVDVTANNFSVDVEQLRAAVTPKTKAVMVVHLLGNPAPMGAIMEVAREFGLYVVEDSCEAHGAMIDGKKVGSFGDLSTFSFFFSHHISTIEGGMVLTDDDELADLVRAIRAHGWVREMEKRDEVSASHPNIDSRFLFVTSGYNVRPTDLQGAFGIHQLQRLEPFIEQRRETTRYWIENLASYSDYFEMPTEPANARCVWFAFPLMLKPEAPFQRAALAEFLEGRGIETRPVMAGNMAEQPVMRLYEHRKAGDLNVARWIDDRGILIGNHHGVGQAERELVVEAIRDFVASEV
ncbi:MAG: CDP-6-deoxy-D-xylo-4-hexulose-3-dehydrase [Chloroflexi bacterium]|jgi:CDP-6-deoxy-D-xylo-4-hexulose-3-dehydrase|nr:MAG: CDP-6-deoxy-D-xylo-4-hexulose-3-dehydrase [Chloroflexota bacterium]